MKAKMYILLCSVVSAVNLAGNMHFIQGKVDNPNCPFKPPVQEAGEKKLLKEQNEAVSGKAMMYPGANSLLLSCYLVFGTFAVFTLISFADFICDLLFSNADVDQVINPETSFIQTRRQTSVKERCLSMMMSFVIIFLINLARPFQHIAAFPILFGSFNQILLPILSNLPDKVLILLLDLFAFCSVVCFTYLCNVGLQYYLGNQAIVTEIPPQTSFIEGKIKQKFHPINYHQKPGLLKEDDFANALAASYVCLDVFTILLVLCAAFLSSVMFHSNQAVVEKSDSSLIQMDSGEPVFMSGLMHYMNGGRSPLPKRNPPSEVKQPDAKQQVVAIKTPPNPKLPSKEEKVIDTQPEVKAEDVTHTNQEVKADQNLAHLQLQQALDLFTDAYETCFHPNLITDCENHVYQDAKALIDDFMMRLKEEENESFSEDARKAAVDIKDMTQLLNYSIRLNRYVDSESTELREQLLDIFDDQIKQHSDDAQHCIQQYGADWNFFYLQRIFTKVQTHIDNF